MKLTSTVAAAVLLAPQITAQTTDIDSPSIFEQSHRHILSDALGTNLSKDGLNFSGGGYDAMRITDNLDQIWNAGTYNIEIVARESLFNKKFGYINDEGDFEKILRTTGHDKTASVTIDHDFAWAIKNASSVGGRVYASDESENWDGHDHMVTYNILSGGQSRGYAIFFEDWGGYHSDNDFNDLAVLISIVPLPQGALLAGLGLAGLAVRVQRRR